MQRSRFAVMKDVQIKQGRKEYVEGMVQRGIFAVMKDVPTMFRGEEYVVGMAPLY